jgi:hypothetical protein
MKDIHCNENPIYVFLFWELHGLSPNFHIHVSLTYLYIPRIGQHTYFLQQNRQIDHGDVHSDFFKLMTAIHTVLIDY